MNTETKQLFETFTFGNGIKTKNRIVMAPMTTWASNDDFTVADDEIRHYEARSGNVGLVITGCTRVMANGIGFHNEYASYDDTFCRVLKNWLLQPNKEVLRQYFKFITPEIKQLRN